MGTPRLKVVCDTNTVVSALLFSHGRLTWLRDAWCDGSLVPLVSHATTTELLRVLAYPKFRLSREEQEELLGDYLPFAELAEPTGQADPPPCRDPHDRVFLQLAQHARADALVTGDEDLLTLKAEFPIPIITPTELRARLGRQS